MADPTLYDRRARLTQSTPTYCAKYDLRLCDDGDVTVTLHWDRPEGDWIIGGADVDLLVQPDGRVLLLDPVAGHYTRCHSLPEAVQDRARALARRLWAEEEGDV